MSITFGVDPVVEAVQHALRSLDAGERVVERERIDLKEEAGRRGDDGTVLPGTDRSERAAQQIAGEAACMSNTPGGGALIIGVSDDSTLIGTELDAEWVRRRVHELTQGHLTVDATVVHIRGVRLLVVRSPQAIEPIRHRGKIHWRVGDRCVEIDAASWHERRAYVTHHDWSAQPSHLDESHARATSVEVARGFLRESGESHARDLADVPTADLLRRLNVVTGDGRLTHAGVLAFVGRDTPALDYVRREHAGGDSTTRVRRGGRGVLDELVETFQAFGVHNPVTHVGDGLARGQVHAIPPRAAREAVVNAIAHRDWTVGDPATVEHIGVSLVVTSPGGFYGGVEAANVINHPSRSRNTALTELLASIRVAEREGIGVDRMFQDSLRQGNRLPELEELATPAVRVSLSGERRDPAWPVWLGRIDDRRATADLRWLMSLYHLVTVGWADLLSLAPFLQTSAELTADVVSALWATTIDRRPLLERVDGVPSGAPDAWRLSPSAVGVLRDLDDLGAFRRPWPEPGAVALSYARARGRISTTELGSLLGRAPSNVGSILGRLEDEGRLEPSRPNRRGAGFFYRYVP